MNTAQIFKYLAIFFFCFIVPSFVLPDKASVVVVAGSDSQTVFDEATKAIQAYLPSGVARFTADPASDDARYVTLDRVEAALAAQGGSCFLYVTSHGRRNSGIQFGRQLLSPDRLDAILRKSCGDKPTLVILSACYSGQFLKIARPNMTMLTASDHDRVSFGCSTNRKYTYWDGCLLQALEGGERDLAKLYRETWICTGKLEATLGLGMRELSLPMFYQGEKGPKVMP